MTTPVHDQPVLYSATEVCQMAGISYRNLDYWIRCGYVDIDHPESMRAGSGSHRQFSRTDIDRFARLSRLVHAGLKVEVAADATRRMVDDEVLLNGGVRIHLEPIDG